MKNSKLVFIIFSLIFLFQSNLSATEYATFESFYVESSYVGWVLAGIFAILAGLAIYFSFGTATPAVAAIGTWVGTMAGYSGIAATNYGLALIGFGSIATGGLGIAGGTAILTVALVFSTEVVIDYTLSNVVSSYSYSKFAEDSKKMITLPIPQNEDGSDAYKNTIIHLKKDIKNEIPLSADSNQIILKNALSSFTPDAIDKEEFVKENTLKSYLYFATNDYKNAITYATDAISGARKLKIKRTLPAFIYATSSLYKESFDFNTVTNDYFRYSILAEPDNKLAPLMFSIYLDRVMYRMNDDNSLNHSAMNTIRDVAFEIKDDNIQNQSLVIVMMRYFIKLKIEQQKIIALANSKNLTIKKNNKTLIVVGDSFIEYQNLLKSLSKILIYPSIKEHIKNNQDLNKIFITYGKYEESETYLKRVIHDLEEYQFEQEEAEKARLKKEEAEKARLKKEEAEKARLKKEEKKWWKFW
jgi:hypothetical protein